MPPRFTAAELEVMQVLWDGGEFKPAEIQASLDRQVKNSALRSVLAVLLEKGHVTRRQKGKAFFYRARTRQASTFRKMLGELADVFCGGSREALVMRLIQSERLTEEELLELKRLADEDAAPPHESQ